MIIFGQGAIRCHPFVLDEMAAAQSMTLPLSIKPCLVTWAHVGSSMVRSFWLGLTNGRTSATPVKDSTRRYYQQLNRLSANLALLSDVSMGVLGVA